MRSRPQLAQLFFATEWFCGEKKTFCFLAEASPAAQKSAAEPVRTTVHNAMKVLVFPGSTRRMQSDPTGGGAAQCVPRTRSFNRNAKARWSFSAPLSRLFTVLVAVMVSVPCVLCRCTFISPCEATSSSNDSGLCTHEAIDVAIGHIALFVFLPPSPCRFSIFPVVFNALCLTLLPVHARSHGAHDDDGTSGVQHRAYR